MSKAKKELKFSGLSRSELMSRIKSKGNKKTEMAFLAGIKKHHISGWRRHGDLPGKPDFVFRDAKLVVFLDGCFWHGCPIHYKAPRTRRIFWNSKIERNKSRDRKNNRMLRSLGWKVIHIWEHDLTKSRIERVLARLKIKLNADAWL